ncbi:hypothetical protein [Flavobacterium silvaticum]|uniref:Uncharacterized protein n=1 Tax=Flavobacterium silvaticum TaxID=1852020 RepID=A0A972FLV3_9FLAO|nr:hypothetical protein [Flavobacterium silvaticum]NMH28449.1 hypothetical protein [Flavobacterium silvaticum]
MKNTEIKNINENINGEIPKGTKIIVQVKNVDEPEKIVRNTKEIMLKISNFAYTNEWPTDKEWKVILPEWFVKSMTDKSLEEIMKTKGQWHFESWISNIKDRAWIWHSSKIEERGIKFVLETLSYPYLQGTFLYILFSQGISMAHIEVIDDLEME